MVFDALEVNIGEESCLTNKRSWAIFQIADDIVERVDGVSKIPLVGLLLKGKINHFQKHVERYQLNDAEIRIVARRVWRVLIDKPLGNDNEYKKLDQEKKNAVDMLVGKMLAVLGENILIKRFVAIGVGEMKEKVKAENLKDEDLEAVAIEVWRRLRGNLN